MGTDVFKLIEDTPIFSDYIKSDEEIDQETLAKIREKYSEADEMKLHRQMINGENVEEYENYNDYVEECRAEGQAKKLINQERLSSLVPYDLGENGETKIIMVDNENV